MCVFSSHSFWTSSLLDVPAGVTQEEGHTGFFIHRLSAVRALIILARRIQPFLSLVDRAVKVTHMHLVFPSLCETLDLAIAIYGVQSMRLVTPSLDTHQS